jgi:uncharacterized membrane-anchored protein
MSNPLPRDQANTDSDPEKPTGSAAAFPRARGDAAHPMRSALRMLRKVPEITVYFWIIKLLTTAMGEVTSDFFVYKYNPYVVVSLGGIGLAAALVLQLLVPRYVPWIYWLAVVMVAIFGTMAADVVHIELGIPYLVSTVFFAVALAVIFATWYTSEKTLSIHSIDTRRRELFYWATVLATFALGTATGDMTAITLGLGYFSSGVLFAVVFAIPGLAYWRLGLNGIFAFWLAYVLTRPLGASFADWVGKSRAAGGRGLGTGWVSLALTLVIACFVGYLTVTRKDVSVEPS